MTTNIASFPRRRYTEYQTPIQYLNNFSKELNGPNVYVKRDDLLGLTAGGNKTRKLEFLIADALAKGADTIITCGATQSNHCRLTLSAAVKEGLKCILVLEEVVPDSYYEDANGNILLYHLLGAENITVVPKGTNMLQAMETVAESLKAQGRKPYMIPVGGSNEIGALGYTLCAEEIIEQASKLDVKFDYIVSASGSGGTHAGLIAGLIANNCTIPVVGISVSKERAPLTELVHDLTEKTAKLIGIDKDISAELIHCNDEYVGPGYTVKTKEMVESVQLLARSEGILLDPVYTGKVMAGLIDLSRKGFFKKDDNVLFLHTGGLPTVFLDPAALLKG